MEKQQSRLGITMQLEQAIAAMKAIVEWYDDNWQIVIELASLVEEGIDTPMELQLVDVTQRVSRLRELINVRGEEGKASSSGRERLMAMDNDNDGDDA